MPPCLFAPLPPPGTFAFRRPPIDNLDAHGGKIGHPYEGFLGGITTRLKEKK